MTPEQKKRAAEVLAAWRATAYALHGDAMADLLQEMVDAPEHEPEPVAYQYVESGKPIPSFQVKAPEPKYAHFYRKLYAAPPAPSAPEDVVRDAVAAEREACAKLCDEQHDRARTSTGASRANSCAVAIRARGEKGQS